MAKLNQKDDIKYPDVEVALTDLDGNAFAVIGAVRKAPGATKEDKS